MFAAQDVPVGLLEQQEPLGPLAPQGPLDLRVQLVLVGQLEAGPLCLWSSSSLNKVNHSNLKGSFTAALLLCLSPAAYRG